MSGLELRTSGVRTRTWPPPPPAPLRALVVFARAYGVQQSNFKQRCRWRELTGRDEREACHQQTAASTGAWQRPSQGGAEPHTPDQRATRKGRGKVALVWQAGRACASTVPATRGAPATPSRAASNHGGGEPASGLVPPKLKVSVAWKRAAANRRAWLPDAPAMALGSASMAPARHTPGPLLGHKFPRGSRPAPRKPPEEPA